MQILTSDLHAFVARGPNTGTPLFPHRHVDGKYVVAMTRFEKDYVRLENEDDILMWLNKGYRLRMSNSDEGLAPSLIRPESIFMRVQ